MARIFISYRRSDTITITGRIHDRLTMEFGDDNIFKDVDDIPLGADFRQIIDREVGSCDVLLVMIGPEWIHAMAGDGSARLDDPDDFVRVEIEAGLKRDDVLVIPVLVRGAGMPNSGDMPHSLRELAYRNAAIVRDDPDFHRDMSRLISQIHKHIDIAGTKEVPMVKPHTPEPVSKQVAVSKTVTPSARVESAVDSKVNIETGTRLPMTWIGVVAAVIVVVIVALLVVNRPQPEGSGIDPDSQIDGLGENSADSGALIIPTDETLQIAVAIDSDDGAVNGAMLRGVEVAQQDRPELYIGDSTIGWDFLPEEGHCADESSIAISERVIGSNRVLGVVGHACDPGCTATASPYSDALFTTISPACNIPPGELAAYPSFNQISAGGLSDGAIAAEFAYHDLGMHTVAIVHDATDEGFGLTGDFIAHFEELGGEIVTVIQLDGAADSLDNAVGEIADSDAQLVYYGGTAQPAADLIYHAGGAGNLGPGLMFGNPDEKNAFAEMVGDMGNGTYFVVPALTDSDAYYNFAATYATLTGEAPAPTAVYAYDAAMMLLDAAENLGTLDDSGALVIDRAAMQEYIRTYSNDSVSGYLDCDGSGSCGGSAYILYVLDGGSFSEYTRR